jgi:inner membrane protein
MVRRPLAAQACTLSIPTVSPESHLLASWIIAAKTTDNLRDCRLVTLAGILPDADGLGLIVDLATET